MDRPATNVPSPRQFAGSLGAEVRGCLETLAARFFPGLELPGYFLGQRVTYMDRADFAYVLVNLHRLGVTEVAGVPVRNAVRRLLRSIDGPATTTFYSYRVAEALLAFGPSFEENPLLDGLTTAERENLRQATDSTEIYDAATGSIGNWANNYWAVLARCELRRAQLGLLPDRTLLDIALERVEALLAGGGRGFFDDSRELAGRYDIYSADVHLFCEPLWPQLDPARLLGNLRAHIRLLETAALENGAFLAYGRSIGALSVCMTMELGAVSLRLGLAADPARTFGLIGHARRQFFDGWMADGLIAAHRGRMTEGYRGIHRQLQMTLDCLGKLCFVAQQLEDAPAAETPAAPVQELFPTADVWIAFEDERPAGLWMFRNEAMAFQLACVDGYNADYAAIPRAPGRFENPVDSLLICGLPRAALGGADFSCLALPVSVEKVPHGLWVAHDGFRQTSGGPEQGKRVLPGRREAEYRVEGNTLTVTERWTFAQVPDALTFALPEADTPLQMEVLSMPPGAHASVGVVEGMAEWRSCWGRLRRVHQVNFPPAPEVRFCYRVTG